MKIQNLIVALPGADLRQIRRKAAQSPECETAVISFAACPELESICRQRSFSYVSGGLLLDQAEVKYASEYDSLISSIPDTHPELMKSCIWKDLPLWWAHELREKNTLVYPAMLRSFRALAVRDWIEEFGPKTITVYTDIPASAEPIRAAVPGRKFSIDSSNPLKETRPRIFLSRLLNFRRMLYGVGQARRFKEDQDSVTSSRVIFLSPIRYLRQIADAGIMDKYLLDTPKLTDRKLGAFHCFTIFGNRLGISTEESRQACEFLSGAQHDIPLDFTVLESYLDKEDVIRSFWSLSRLLNEVQYGTRLAPVQLAGMDLAPIFKRELGRSIASAPYNRLSAVGLNRLLKKHQPKCVCTYSFEHGWGRLINYAVQRESIPFVGFQHGPWSRRYALIRWSVSDVRAGMPVPDTMVLDGEYPKRIFRDVGIPEQRLAVAGACRYDHYEMKGEKKNPETRILAASSLYDTRELAQFVSSSGLGKIFRIVFKPHPSSYSDLDSLGKEYPDMEFVDRDVTELIRESAIMVCTFSSVAFEAMMHGKKVISVLPEGAINMAPWGDNCEFAPVLRDPGELTAAVDRLLKDETDTTEQQVRFLKDLLGPLDGKSCYRAARIMEAVAAPSERQ